MEFEESNSTIEDKLLIELESESKFAIEDINT